MAPRLSYQVKPAKVGPDAHEELERLLETLHHHGALRLANDLVAANAGIVRVLVEGLSKPGSLNAIQNLSILLMALSRIPPAEFYKVVFAFRDAFEAVSQHKAEEKHGDAPGISGAYRMLHDEDLWGALMPLIAGLKTFAGRLDRPVDKPISDFTGKPSDA